MIPALMGKKKTAALVIGMKDDAPEKEAEGESEDEMELVAEDLLKAMAAKDPKMIAQALKAAFAIADAMPHEEGEHI